MNLTYSLPYLTKSLTYSLEASILSYMCVLSHFSLVQLFATPWTVEKHAWLPCPSLPPRVCSYSCPLSWQGHPTISFSLVPFSPCQHQGLFKWVSSSIRWPKYWSFSFSISPSSEYLGLISFRMDWFDLLAIQRTHKSFLQHYSLKASNFQFSAFFMVQVSHTDMPTGKTIAVTIQTFVRESKLIETALCSFLLVPPLIFITLWGILAYPPFHRWRNRNSEIRLLKVLFPVKKI